MVIHGPILKKSIEVGGHYVLTYTRPMYDKTEHRYLPDNFRFTEPYVRKVAYGGICKDGQRYCAVCGRKGNGSYMFLDLESFQEFFISRHCLLHDSTQIWPIESTDKDVEAWYARENLRRGAEAGDPIAGAAVIFGALDDDDIWYGDEREWLDHWGEEHD